MNSTLKQGLKRKYAIKHFLAFTAQGKEALWQGLTLIVGLSALSYFIAHWLLWLTGYYSTPGLAVLITH